MNEVQKEINEAFAMLHAIPVTGDSVELLAAAKEHLRRAYRLAGTEKEEDDG